jgi:hypothetical protein
MFTSHASCGRVDSCNSSCVLVLENMSVADFDLKIWSQYAR